MTSLIPNPPYSNDKLQQLYPPHLELHQVQFFFRHGERTPITSGFAHLGLLPYWPLCDVAGKFTSIALTDPESNQFGNLPWKRRLEALRPDDGPMLVQAANGKRDSVCAMGELTDMGRRSMYNLGQRIRHLYVNQLGFMPETLDNQDSLYIRASCWPRALESTHQAFLGFYPHQYRAKGFVPDIVQRSARDETLMPNEEYCTRFIDMMKAYSQRAADRWNNSEEMDYLNSLLQRHMPGGQRVAIDSMPRIAGIYDAINSTQAAQDPLIKLPTEFYDAKARTIIDKFAYGEEFGPFHENHEYRTLGIGALLGDIVERMTESVDSKGWKDSIKMAVCGGHDSTLMGLLGGLGALEDKDRVWPPYSSSVAIELFRDPTAGTQEGSSTSDVIDPVASGMAIGRTPTAELNSAQKQNMKGYYVRMRYNDNPVVIPGCRTAGNHLSGDQSFCTLAAFKAICDKITPRDIKKSCITNLDKPVIPNTIEEAGF